MVASNFSTDSHSARDEGYIHLVDEISERLQSGERVDIDDYCQAHPQYAEQLRRLIPALEVLAGMGGKMESNELTDSLPGGKALGDFQLVRQIGRGGMGVVYEAMQLSLNRRVAVKVLPFASMLDPRQLQRFKNEAQAAASLEHPHIVNVIFVGCERGVHFFAMRYIDGESLAQVIDECHQIGSPSHGTAPIAAISTEYSSDRRSFYRTIARLGIEAARAIEHAHQVGMVHRDIKPSNLLIDREGQLWVTDFGLASVQGNSNLTMSGDLLGTLRYMSPEQASGRKGVVDHRTDIYSLGVTLYELLTGRTPFDSDDRQSLLRQIEEREPVPPRSCDAGIPVDLETIVLKAMAKSDRR
jgi:serine/threonine protein kinase